MSGIRSVEMYYTICPNTNCWLWIGSLDKDGYGLFYFNRKLYRAHRFVFSRVRYLPKDKQLDHLCEIKKCVNPNHLKVSNNKENSQRRLSNKLNIQKIIEIRKLLLSGISQKEIAKTYLVDASTISKIRNNHIWSF